MLATREAVKTEALTAKWCQLRDQSCDWQSPVRPTLNDQTEEFRVLYDNVNQLITQEGLFDWARAYVTTVLINYVPLEGIGDLLFRKRTFNRKVAQVVKEAAEGDFKNVIYPCFGSDLTLPLAFQSDRIVGIDKRDPLGFNHTIPEGAVLSLSEGLIEKALESYQANKGAASVVNLCLDLALNQVDGETIVFQDQQPLRTNQPGAFQTTFTFDAGKNVEVIIINGVRLRKANRNDNSSDDFVSSDLVPLLQEGRSCLLQKGGRAFDYSIAPLWGLMREGTVAVSEMIDVMDWLEHYLPYGRQRSLKTAAIMEKLAIIQGRPVDFLAGRNYDPQLKWGYLDDLAHLSILERLPDQLVPAVPLEMALPLCEPAFGF